MDEIIIDCKVSEYTGRACIALKLGQRAKARSAAKMTVLLSRLQARAAIQTLAAAEEALRATDRAMKKAKQQGVLFPLGEQRVEKLRSEVKEAREDLIAVGRATCTILDVWQGLGASLAELCNICNRDYAQAVRGIPLDRLGESFSTLVFAGNLDYKDPRNRDFIDNDVDAPLTHAVTAFWMDRLCHTEEGRKAAHEVMEAIFPEVMENAMTLVTDADGVGHLIDKDGVEVGTVGEEE